MHEHHPMVLEHTMTDSSQDYLDRPAYDVGFLRYVAAGSAFILTPVFLLMMLTESDFTLWIGLLWISVPVIVFLVPYLLVIPAVVSLTVDRVEVRHGVWTLKIPYSVIEYCEIVPAPPSWVNNHYMFPNAQWVHVRKDKGLFKSWYIPATSATSLTLAIRKRRE